MRKAARQIPVFTILIFSLRAVGSLNSSLWRLYTSWAVRGQGPRGTARHRTDGDGQDGRLLGRDDLVTIKPSSAGGRIAGIADDDVAALTDRLAALEAQKELAHSTDKGLVRRQRGWSSITSRTQKIIRPKILPSREQLFFSICAVRASGRRCYRITFDVSGEAPSRGKRQSIFPWPRGSRRSGLPASGPSAGLFRQT
jgi:hypothetical protein